MTVYIQTFLHCDLRCDAFAAISVFRIRGHLRTSAQCRFHKETNKAKWIVQDRLGRIVLGFRVSPSIQQELDHLLVNILFDSQMQGCLPKFVLDRSALASWQPDHKKFHAKAPLQLQQTNSGAPQWKEPAAALCNGVHPSLPLAGLVSLPAEASPSPRCPHQQQGAKVSLDSIILSNGPHRALWPLKYCHISLRSSSLPRSSSDRLEALFIVAQRCFSLVTA
jgi:hypothetical protein